MCSHAVHVLWRGAKFQNSEVRKTHLTQLGSLGLFIASSCRSLCCTDRCHSIVQFLSTQPTVAVVPPQLDHTRRGRHVAALDYASV